MSVAPPRGKTALITGITGQDGSYLAELLLEKGYVVHGIKRRASSFNTDRIDHLYQDPHESDPRLVLHYGDLTDSSNLIRIIQQVQPDEIYNLGAQSHVAVSFEGEPDAGVTLGMYAAPCPDSITQSRACDELYGSGEHQCRSKSPRRRLFNQFRSPAPALKTYATNTKIPLGNRHWHTKSVQIIPALAKVRAVAF